MKIPILDPTTKNMCEVSISPAMEKHFSVHENHAHTILNQINRGDYMRWFEAKRDLVVLDIGANVGLTALHFMPACKVLVAVEPTPSHFNLCSELIYANAPVTLIKAIHNKALTPYSGEFDFFTCSSSTENRITKPGQSEGVGTVIKTIGYPLADYLNEMGSVVDFCKVDIEGGEMEALTVEQLENAHDKVKMFFVEVHPTAGYSQQYNFDILASRFATTAYKIERINFETFTATSEHKFDR